MLSWNNGTYHTHFYALRCWKTVSYTHLDVYKRQAQAIMTSTGISLPIVDGGWSTMATDVYKRQI